MSFFGGSYSTVGDYTMLDPVILQYESIGYLIEVLIAELLFLHSYKKRTYFPLRLIGSTVVSLAIVSRVSLSPNMSPLHRFFLLLFIIAVSILCMLVSFEGDVFSIISSCMAGVATQHIANKLEAILVLTPLTSSLVAISPVYRILTEVLSCILVYGIVYFLVAKDYVVGKGDIRLNIISVLIILTCIGVNRLVVDHEVVDVKIEVAASIYAIICCIFALGIQFYLLKWQREKSEAMVIRGLLSASEKQYEQWKTMVEMNKIAMHDLKHMIGRVEALADKDNIAIPDLTPLKDKIEGFSPLVRTGNDVLDVLLRNMGQVCHRQNVRLNCVSYTDCLGNYDSMKLYFLFANAIDNARAGADTVEDPEKRLIDVSIKQFGESIIIHVWNYYSGNISFEDELPKSENPESGHGFGLKSIKMITDSFGGAMKAYTENDIFHLNIILPMNH